MSYLDIPSKFHWETLGDINLGRGNLGLDMPVLIYRLMQYTMKDVMTRHLGNKEAGLLFHAAGHLAGIELAKNMLDLNVDFDSYISQLQQKLKELKIGIFRIERSDLSNLNFTLTIAEDLDCSGLPITEDTVCDYDEGFIAGLLEAYTGKKFNVKEVDCWASGERTCRFDASIAMK